MTFSYVAGFFDRVEINTSFHGPPRGNARRSLGATGRRNPRFRFTANSGRTSRTNETRPPSTKKPSRMEWSRWSDPVGSPQDLRNSAVLPK
jgi:hypothetical protein